MSCAYTAGDCRCREMAILRHDSTLDIKGLWGGFGKDARSIEKILYYISCVGLIESVLLNLSSLVGQKENAPISDGKGLPFGTVDIQGCPFLAGHPGAYRCTCTARHRCLKGNMVGALMISPACFTMRRKA